MFRWLYWFLLFVPGWKLGVGWDPPPRPNTLPRTPGTGAPPSPQEKFKWSPKKTRKSVFLTIRFPFFSKISLVTMVTNLWSKSILVAINIWLPSLLCTDIMIWAVSTVSLIKILSVADPDPFGFVSFWSAGSGSASMKRIRIRVAKNQPKSWKISTKVNLNH